MINIRAIGKKKKNGDGKTSSFWGVGFANGNITVQNDEVQGVNIWGQYHDHSGDVNGDMQVDGNITSTGNLSVNSASVQNNLEVGGNISANNATLNGELTVDDVDAINIDSGTITTHDLVVTGNAHFFNLTIDEIKSVGGQIILSAANATVDFVQETGPFYMLAWNKTDGDKSIENNFKVNDQIICQTFNVADELGDPSNKYYWALVTSVGDATITLEDGDHDMHYVEISRTDYDGDGEPEIGDKICQLGYRGTDDTARQSAIILSAYQSPDPNVTAPSMVQYEGINTFSLDGKAKNIISHGNNTFTGNFRVVSNGTTTNIVDLINGQNPQVITDSEQSWIMADSNGKLAKALGGPVKNLDDLVAGLKRLDAAGIDLATALELTDKRSVAAFETFINGADSILQLRDSITGVNGAFNDMYKEMGDNTQGSLNILKSTFEGLILRFYEGKGAFKSFIDMLTQFVQGISDSVGKASGPIDLLFTLLSRLFKIVGWLLTGISKLSGVIYIATAAWVGYRIATSAVVVKLKADNLYFRCAVSLH